MVYEDRVVRQIVELERAIKGILTIYDNVGTLQTPAGIKALEKARQVTQDESWIDGVQRTPAELAELKRLVQHYREHPDNIKYEGE